MKQLVLQLKETKAEKLELERRFKGSIKSMKSETSELQKKVNRLVKDLSSIKTSFDSISENLMKTNKKLVNLEIKNTHLAKKTKALRTNILQKTEEALIEKLKKKESEKLLRQPEDSLKNLHAKIKDSKGNITLEAANFVLESIHEGLTCAGIETVFSLISKFLEGKAIDFISLSSI